MQRAFGSIRQFSSQAGKMVRTPIPLFGLEGRYTMALFSAASKQQQLDAVEKDLKKLHDTIDRDTKFREFLANPLINATQKKEIISKTVQSKLGVSDLTVNLLNAMTDAGRLKLLSSVAKSYIKVMQVTRGELEVTVITASPVTDDATRKEIEAAVKGFTSKQLLINYRVDPSIRGGLIVDFGGENYVDLSLRSKLKAYSDVIKQGL